MIACNNIETESLREKVHKTILKQIGEIEMKEVSHNEWMNTVKKLNEGQPNVIDLVNHQIESYENDKEGRDE